MADEIKRWENFTTTGGKEIVIDLTTIAACESSGMNTKVYLPAGTVTLKDVLHAEIFYPAKLAKEKYER